MKINEVISVTGRKWIRSIDGRRTEVVKEVIFRIKYSSKSLSIDYFHSFDQRIELTEMLVPDFSKSDSLLTLSDSELLKVVPKRIDEVKIEILRRIEAFNNIIKNELR